MDFELTDELAALQETCRRIAQDKVKPRAREIDETERVPAGPLRGVPRRRACSACASRPRSAAAAPGILGLTIAIEEVAKYSNTAALMLLLTRLPTGPVMIAGLARAERSATSPPIADGSQRAAFCLSEPQAGSDVMGMRTKAVRDGDDWVLNGTKCWISGVAQADWYTVFAKTSRRRDRAATTTRSPRSSSSGAGTASRSGALDRKMGVRGVDTGELLLHDVRVPAANVIGEVGGFRLAMLGLNSMRPIVAARGIGLAEGALMYATEYVKERAAFSQTIADFQGIQWEIAKLATEIEAARLLTYRAAWLADQGQFTKEWVPYLSMAKYYATELAVKASNVCLQMLGAAGYMKDHMTELYYRDAKQLTIVEGTTQVQLGLIARGVLDRDLWWD